MVQRLEEIFGSEREIEAARIILDTLHRWRGQLTPSELLLSNAERLNKLSGVFTREPSIDYDNLFAQLSRDGYIGEFGIIPPIVKLDTRFRMTQEGVRFYIQHYIIAPK